MSTLFASKLTASTVGDRPHREAFAKSLLTSVPHLPIVDHKAILDGLERDGLASNVGGVVQAAGNKASSPRFQVMTIAQASAATKEPLYFRSLIRKLERIGYSVNENERINNVELTRCLRASGETNSPELRMQYRSELYAAGLLEP
jgi:hypothetical protein